jgi:hypothetical protein
MSAMSDYLEQQLANHIFRASTFSKPTGLHVGLFTSATTDAGGGTELSGNGYARAALAPSDSNWTLTGGTISNASNQTITFPTPTGNWGTVTHFGIFTASTGGSLLFHGALTASKTVNQGDTVTFPGGQLQITFD